MPKVMKDFLSTVSGCARRPEAKVSVFDHGYLYGDGVFEGIRAYGGHVFRLKEHFERHPRGPRASIELSIPCCRNLKPWSIKACARMVCATRTSA